MNVVNTTGSTATYALEFAGLTKRQISVANKDWGRIRITGRTGGTYAVTVKRNNELVISSPLRVDCDEADPYVSEPEISIVNACRYRNGYVLFQFSNPTITTRAYIITLLIYPYAQIHPIRW